MVAVKLKPIKLVLWWKGPSLLCFVQAAEGAEMLNVGRTAVRPCEGGKSSGSAQRFLPKFQSNALQECLQHTSSY